MKKNGTRLLALLLAAMLVLTACGGGGKDDTPGGGETTPPSTDTGTPTEPAAPAEPAEAEITPVKDWITYQTQANEVNTFLVFYTESSLV